MVYSTFAVWNFEGGTPIEAVYFVLAFMAGSLLNDVCKGKRQDDNCGRAGTVAGISGLNRGSREGDRAYCVTRKSLQLHVMGPWPVYNWTSATTAADVSGTSGSN